MYAHKNSSKSLKDNLMHYEGIHILLDQIVDLILKEKLNNSDAVCQLYYECIQSVRGAIEEESDPFFSHSLEQVLGILGWHARIINQRKGSFHDGQQQLALHANEPHEVLQTCINDGESWSTDSDCTRTDSAEIDMDETLPQPLNHYGLNQSASEVNQVGQDDLLGSIRRHPSIHTGLQDVAGLCEAKRLLNQAIILPLQYPQLFRGARRPWKRILLYGPPGTGKTRLAHAIAGQAGLPFYCISSADLLSSWVGESEKTIRDIFQKMNRAPGSSIIFIDEIDGLCRKRNSKEEDHSRRLKTELLNQMEESTFDGCSNNLILLGATNCPWDLDVAFLRRFQRRIYIPLPDRDARKSIINIHLMEGGDVNCTKFTEFEWNQLLDATDGYSGSDLANLTMSALLEPIRDLQESKYWLETSDGKMVPCIENHPGAISCSLQDIAVEKVTSRDVTISDFIKGLKTTQSTNAKDDISKYSEFTNKFGFMA